MLFFYIVHPVSLTKVIAQDISSPFHVYWLLHNCTCGRRNARSLVHTVSAATPSRFTSWHRGSCCL